MAAADPYQTLGVARDATPEQIRVAYRKLAKQLHPDLNPGDKGAEERFKAVSVANELLSDPDKRARFDRGEIDAAGQERPEQHFYRGHAEGGQGGNTVPAPAAPGFTERTFSEEELGDLFGDLFARRGQAGNGGACGNPDARRRPALSAGSRLSRRRAGGDAPAVLARRANARCARASRHRGRSDAAPARPGRRGPGGRPGGRCADRDRDCSASAVPPRGQRHPSRPAGVAAARRCWGRRCRCRRRAGW